MQQVPPRHCPKSKMPCLLVSLLPLVIKSAARARPSVWWSYRTVGAVTQLAQTAAVRLASSRLQTPGPRNQELLQGLVCAVAARHV